MVWKKIENETVITRTVEFIFTFIFETINWEQFLKNIERHICFFL